MMMMINDELITRLFFFAVIWKKKRVSRALLDRLSVRSDEVLMLKLLSLKLFTVANLRYQLSW